MARYKTGKSMKYSPNSFYSHNYVHEFMYEQVFDRLHWKRKPALRNIVEEKKSLFWMDCWWNVTGPRLRTQLPHDLWESDYHCTTHISINLHNFKWTNVEINEAIAFAQFTQLSDWKSYISIVAEYGSHCFAPNVNILSQSETWCLIEMPRKDVSSIVVTDYDLKY